MAEKAESLKDQVITDNTELAGEQVFGPKNELLGLTPTEEELATLRKVSDKLPWSAWSVAVVELGERFTYYGVTGPFQNYMQNERGGLRPGAIGLGQQSASALSYFFQFWCCYSHFWCHYFW